MVELKPRAAERRRCYFAARIIFDGRNKSLDVMVRNVSPLGALIEAEDLSAVPLEFDLIIGSFVGESSVRRARRIWQDNGVMGVAFDTTADEEN